MQEGCKTPSVQPWLDVRHVDVQAIRGLLVAQLPRGVLGSHLSSYCSAYICSKGMGYASARLQRHRSDAGGGLVIDGVVDVAA